MTPRAAIGPATWRLLLATLGALGTCFVPSASHVAFAQDKPAPPPSAAPKVDDAADAGLALVAAAREERAERIAETARRFAQADRERAQAVVETRRAALAERRTIREAAAKALADAEQAEDKSGVPVAQAALKTATEAQTAAEKVLAESEPRAAEFVARAARLDERGAQPDPAAIREVASWQLGGPALGCVFDPLGRFAYAAGETRTVARWDLVTAAKTEFTGSGSWVRSLDLSADGRQLLGASFIGRLVAWDAESATSAPARVVAAHKGSCRTVCRSPDGQWLATGGNDGLVRIWNAADGSQVAELTAHRDAFRELIGKPDQVFVNLAYAVAFHPSGRTLVSGDLMGVVKEWEVGSWRHLRDLDAGELHKYDTTFKAHCGGTRSLDFSADGRFLVVGGIGEVSNAFAGIGVATAVLFDLESGAKTVMKAGTAGQGSCWGIRFDPSGRYVVGAGGTSSGMLWFWRTGEAKSYFDFKVPQLAYDVAWHPDGLRLATAQYDGTLRIYDTGPPPPKPATPPAKPAEPKK